MVSVEQVRAAENQVTASGLLREVFRMFSHELGMFASVLSGRENVSMVQLLPRGVNLSCAAAGSGRDESYQPHLDS